MHLDLFHLHYLAENIAFATIIDMWLSDQRTEGTVDGEIVPSREAAIAINQYEFICR